MLSRKITALQGVVGAAVTVSCRLCVPVCDGVGDNDRVGVFSQFALVFVFPATRGRRWCRHNLVSMEAALVREGEISDFLQGMVSDCFDGELFVGSLSVPGRHNRFSL